MFLISNSNHGRRLSYSKQGAQGFYLYWDNTKAHIKFWLWILITRLDKANEVQASHVEVAMPTRENSMYHFMSHDKTGGD